MKGYGLPRHTDLELPDLADIKFYGLAAGQLHPKWTANGDNKRRARRVWKKIERSKVRRELHEIKSMWPSGEGNRLQPCDRQFKFDHGLQKHSGIE